MNNEHGNDKVSCLGKIPYLTSSHAEKALRNMNKGSRFGRMTMYKCFHCNQWHVGESNKRKGRLKSGGK